MKKHLCRTLIACATLAAAGASAQMQPGKWEVTSAVEMQGHPTMAPQKTTICVDNKTADRQPPVAMDPSCQVTDYKMSGNTATWKMQCKGEMAMTGEGSITYSGAQYTGSSTMRMEMKGHPPMTMKNTYTGKRIGNC